MRPGARGARAGGEGPSAAAAPAGLQLTRGHGGAGQAGVAGRCHLRARRAPPRAQPRSRRSRRGPQPMAKSRGRAAGTSLWTLPALPAPPDDALPPPLFMCGFRPPGRLRTLLSASLRASGVGASGGGARGGRSAAIEAPAEPPCGERSHARRGALAARRLPAPSPGRPPSQRHFERPGAKAAGDRQTERPPPSPSAPTPLARTQRKERRRGSSGAGSAAAGLTAPARAAGGGGCGRRGGAGGARAGQSSAAGRCRGGRRGARGSRGCGAQRRREGVKATESGVGGAARCAQPD